MSEWGESPLFPAAPPEPARGSGRGHSVGHCSSCDAGCEILCTTEQDFRNRGCKREGRTQQQPDTYFDSDAQQSSSTLSVSAALLCSSLLSPLSSFSSLLSLFQIIPLLSLSLSLLAGKLIFHPPRIVSSVSLSSPLSRIHVTSCTCTHCFPSTPPLLYNLFRFT